MTTATYPLWHAISDKECESRSSSFHERLVVKAHAFYLRKVNKIRGAMQGACDGVSLAERGLAAMGVSWTLNCSGLDLPPEGPVVVVSNHPYGGIEGLILLSLVCRTRSDVRILATDMLGVVPELRPFLILVDTAGDDRAKVRNGAAMRQCMNWLKQGGVLGVFPAGEVAHFDPSKGGIRESRWNTAVARLVRRTGAMVAPVYFGGSNGLLFQAAGLLNPLSRTALLARELFNKRRRTIRVAVAKPVPFKWLREIEGDRALTDHLRTRVSLLAFGVEEANSVRGRSGKVMKPLAAVTDRIRQADEVSSLSSEHKILMLGEYAVYVASAGQIPAVVREIGRLREIAFRGVGEGTGKALDLDAFDEYYQHLFLWNHRQCEVVGAYRLGLVDTIMNTRGMKGLYTHSQFNFQRRLFDRLCPAMELGRSFVRPEYQRGHLPLMLLWRGIGRYVATQLHYRYLLGTVSMSRSYSDAARGLVAWYFGREGAQQVHASDVRPRFPFRWQCGTVPFTGRGGVFSLEDLDRLISDVEPDGKGLPVLIRHYLRFGGQVLACNVDPDFSMTLDVLMVVDLCRTDPRRLEAFMGPATRDYLDFHKVWNSGKPSFQERQDEYESGECVVRQYERPGAWPHGGGLAQLSLRHAL